MSRYDPGHYGILALKEAFGVEGQTFCGYEALELSYRRAIGDLFICPLLCSQIPQPFFTLFWKVGEFDSRKIA